MGTKYTTNAVASYNASPPSDAGAATEENRVTWAKTKTKLSDPLKTTIDAIDADLVEAFDVGPVSKSVDYTTVAGDHNKTISCTAALTVTLIDAATAAVGYTVNISNQSTGNVTVGRATAGNTINGTAANVTIAPKNAITLRVNTATNGYEVIESGLQDIAGLAKTDGNLIVGDGTNWVAESGATARTTLGLGTAATQNIGTSGATVPVLNNANTWSGQQTFTHITTTFNPGGTSSAGLEIGSTGGASTPYIDFHSGATATDSDSRIVASGGDGTIGSGALTITCGGLILGAPTGGAKGSGTLNAQAVYDDNVLLTCYAIEAELTGKVTKARWDDSALNRELTQPDGRKTVKATTHEAAARFAPRAADMLDPKRYGALWRATGHLAAMPSPAEWEASGKKMAVGDIVQRLWETVEVQAIHIDKLLGMIKAMEARITALGG